MRARGRDPEVIRHRRFLRQLRVIHIELDQGFGMLRNEGDRDNHDTLPLRPGLSDLGVRKGFDPLERPHATLKAEAPSEVRYPQTLHKSVDSPFDLPAVGITFPYGALRQSMSGKEQTIIHSGP